MTKYLEKISGVANKILAASLGKGIIPKTDVVSTIARNIHTPEAIHSLGMGRLPKMQTPTPLSHLKDDFKATKNLRQMQLLKQMR